jgi:hypothetical protein
LLGIHVKAFFEVTLVVLSIKLGPIAGIAWVAIGLCLLYNTLFNHSMSFIIKAGSPKNLERVEASKMRKKQRKGKANLTGDDDMAGLQDSNRDVSLDSDNDKYDGASKEVKKLLRYRTKTLDHLRQFWNKQCAKCEIVKPVRTHHCSSCNSCVFLMDHHCPWINNCVGLENQRYFLLFIFWMWVGLCWNFIGILYTWNHTLYAENKKLMSFVTLCDAALVFIMFFFNGWNWFLALFGQSTIEFWSHMNGVRSLGLTAFRSSNTTCLLQEFLTTFLEYLAPTQSSACSALPSVPVPLQASSGPFR